MVLSVFTKGNSVFLSVTVYAGFYQFFLNYGSCFGDLNGKLFATFHPRGTMKGYSNHTCVWSDTLVLFWNGTPVWDKVFNALVHYVCGEAFQIEELMHVFFFGSIHNTTLHQKKHTGSQCDSQCFIFKSHNRTKETQCFIWSSISVCEISFWRSHQLWRFERCNDSKNLN